MRLQGRCRSAPAVCRFGVLSLKDCMPDCSPHITNYSTNSSLRIHQSMTIRQRKLQLIILQLANAILPGGDAKSETGSTITSSAAPQPNYTSSNLRGTISPKTCPIASKICVHILVAFDTRSNALLQYPIAVWIVDQLQGPKDRASRLAWTRV